MCSVDGLAQRGRLSREESVDISIYVVVNEASKNAACMQADNLRRSIPKSSAGRFRVDMPITDKPRKPLGCYEGSVSHFAVFNVWHRKQENGRLAGGTMLSPPRSWPFFGPFWAADLTQSANGR